MNNKKKTTQETKEVPLKDALIDISNLELISPSFLNKDLKDITKIHKEIDKATNMFIKKVKKDSSSLINDNNTNEDIINNNKRLLTLFNKYAKLNNDYINSIIKQCSNVNKIVNIALGGDRSIIEEEKEDEKPIESTKEETVDENNNDEQRKEEPKEFDATGKSPNTTSSDTTSSDTTSSTTTPATEPEKDSKDSKDLTTEDEYEKRKKEEQERRAAADADAKSKVAAMKKLDEEKEALVKNIMQKNSIDNEEGEEALSQIFKSAPKIDAKNLKERINNATLIIKKMNIDAISNEIRGQMYRNYFTSIAATLDDIDEESDKDIVDTFKPEWGQIIKNNLMLFKSVPHLWNSQSNGKSYMNANKGKDYYNFQLKNDLVKTIEIAFKNNQLGDWIITEIDKNIEEFKNHHTSTEAFELLKFFNAI